MKSNLITELPKPRPKKINAKRFAKIAKKVKKSLEEEERYLRKSNLTAWRGR